MTVKAKLELATEQSVDPAASVEVMHIPKPSAFNLDKFKSKRAAAVAGVETLQTGLPHHSVAQAKDFVRLHHDEDTYWSPELCFVNVPIKGQTRDTLHLIDEELAMRYLPSGKILRFRLALATKPSDVFFLCHLPTRNEDNRTAVYGPVRTVVWEGRSREAPPYPDLRSMLPVGPMQRR
jgi:hypothetical protein